MACQGRRSIMEGDRKEHQGHAASAPRAHVGRLECGQTRQQGYVAGMRNEGDRVVSWRTILSSSHLALRHPRQEDAHSQHTNDLRQHHLHQGREGISPMLLHKRMHACLHGCTSPCALCAPYMLAWIGIIPCTSAHNRCMHGAAHAPLHTTHACTHAWSHAPSSARSPSRCY